VPAVMRHVRKLRDDLVAGVVKGMEKWSDEHLIMKRARFLDPNTLDLEGEKLTASRIIVATGSTSNIPEAWRQFKDFIITSDNFFEQQSLPDTVAVIGLGSVGIELAQAMCQLGVKITAVLPHKNIGGLTDPEIQQYAVNYFSSLMDLHLAEAKIEEANSAGIAIKINDKTVRVQKALVAVGRSPAVNELGLKNLGVKLNQKGLPDVNLNTLQADSIPVFFAGDVNGQRPIQHEASHEGRIAGFNATRPSMEQCQRWPPLSITFTTPNIALVGETYQQLSKNRIEFVSGSASFESQGRARLMNAAVGLLKIYARKNDGLLLGAEIFAPQGEHLAHIIAWSITWNKTIFELALMPYYHPSVEEGLRTALNNAMKYTDVAQDKYFEKFVPRQIHCSSSPVD